MTNGVDIESIIIDELNEDLSRRIQKSIDNSILVDLLIAGGWTAVNKDSAVYDPVLERQQLEWIRDHSVGKYHVCLDRWAFELGQDATLFRLRWA